MVQTVFVVSFFSWLILFNIYESQLWQDGSVPNVVVWLFNVVFEAFFALILAALTVGIAYSASWLWNKR